MFPTTVVNCSYLWCASIDLIRLNYMLTLHSSLIMNEDARDEHLRDFAGTTCILKRLFDQIGASLFVTPFLTDHNGNHSSNNNSSGLKRAIAGGVSKRNLDHDTIDDDNDNYNDEHTLLNSNCDSSKLNTTQTNSNIVIDTRNSDDANAKESGDSACDDANNPKSIVRENKETPVVDEDVKWTSMTESAIMATNDIDSFETWTYVKEFFLEFGESYRGRELQLNGTILTMWILVILMNLIQLFVFNQTLKIEFYVILCVGMIIYLIPTFVTIIIASKIHSNFRKEIELLKERLITEELIYSKKIQIALKQEKSQKEKDLLTNYYQYQSKCVSINAIIKMLESDREKYGFRIFGLRIDKGFVNIMIPVFISIGTIVVRVIFLTFSNL